MNLYVFTVVSFVPDFSADERVNIGVIVGNNDEGFKAAWRPERANLFGLTIEKELAEWIEKDLKPLSIEKLIWHLPFRKICFQLWPLRSTTQTSSDEALAILTKSYLKTNEDLIARGI